jgi:hypothetical protein
MEYLTINRLEKMSACESQVDLFRATFGNRAKINYDNFVKALSVGLDVCWLVFWSRGRHPVERDSERHLRHNELCRLWSLQVNLRRGWITQLNGDQKLLMHEVVRKLKGQLK